MPELAPMHPQVVQIPDSAPAVLTALLEAHQQGRGVAERLQRLGGP